ncbi:MAG: DUF2948 family protein [Alphaproteobacteria bacterium]|nr:DUF2948 family protein [Alphaproteobacteria bacterium]
MTDKPLKLRAEDADDLAILSAALQDAAVPVVDMRFFPEDKHFMLAASRYRWESDRGAGAGGGERITTAVIFDNVTRVRRRGLDQGDGDRILALLAMEAGEGVVDLLFSGDAAIRLEVEKLACRLDDFGEAWPTIFRPAHKG